MDEDTDDMVTPLLSADVLVVAMDIDADAAATGAALPLLSLFLFRSLFFLVLG